MKKTFLYFASAVKNALKMQVKLDTVIRVFSTTEGFHLCSSEEDFDALPNTGYGIIDHWEIDERPNGEAWVIAYPCSGMGKTAPIGEIINNRFEPWDNVD